MPRSSVPTLERADHAPAERTLVQVLRDTAAAHPERPAVDDGHEVLDYATLVRRAEEVADRLRRAGVRRGDRVGVRLPSGTAELYVSVLGVLVAGAAYVPVDADDPRERARLVFRTAGVRATLTSTGLRVRDADVAAEPVRVPDGGDPGPDDDAWVIFTSGSTGTPKGVAVRHRSAAAFVDAEARLFLQDAPIGPGDRVLAGLSVAFDASCEEMWLAWRHGACLVPAPRALVRSGMDLAPWLVDRGITVVSTVPTLASLWPSATLDAVRLLVFGGEVCPPELVDRLATPGREVWNTYGPTEATVVACAAQLHAGEPVRIGLPLDGWSLAVVGEDGAPVADGQVGELVIGGVGLARYLDPELDATRFAPMPSLGWQRAYRSGDLVRAEPEGLAFVGRADDQVKVGGRRIELGEVDAALLRLPEVGGAAAAVRTTPGGTKVLVGYVTTRGGAPLDRAAALARLRESLPAALVTLLAAVDDIPTRTSGKVDRDALPWPLPSVSDGAADASLDGTAAWLAGLWSRVLGTPATAGSDFLADGGGSLAAAQLVAAARERYPQATVADVYENPGLLQLAARLDELAPADTDREPARPTAPVPLRAQVVMQLVSALLAVATGLRWLTLAGTAALVVDGPRWFPDVRWWALLPGWLLLLTPWGRMAGTVAVARTLLRGLRPGTYPRGGSVHLRLWAAQSVADALGADGLAGAPWIPVYARALGCRIGKKVDLHSLPPVTGMLTLGKRASVEPEVDLSGVWVEGDVVHVGRVRVGAGATVRTRTVLLPGARVGQDAEVSAGSAVGGSVPPDELWSGSPATRTGVAHRDWPRKRGPRDGRWAWVYGLTAVALACLPVVSLVAALLVVLPAVDRSTGPGDAAVSVLARALPAALVALLVQLLLTGVTARLLQLGLREGDHPVLSRRGWQVWATHRLLDDARTWLYPVYASLLTPTWLRVLGARVGRGVEASTVLLLPRTTTVGDHAFLADDTLVGSYQLAHGWLRVRPAVVGERAFLGNSGMTAGGRQVPDGGLVAVLSKTPAEAGQGTSWLGSPPVLLQRAPAARGDDGPPASAPDGGAAGTTSDRTFAPARRLVV
ncbi:non-ribosomal peptide synthetase, partial [Angustibacter aerolatus]